MREDRPENSLRPIKIKRDYLKNALGSCMIEFGNTRVICSVSVEDKIPPFLRGKGKGWLTAEYGMLPASCKERIDRESSRGKVSGRTHEIQRLIGRSLRAVIDLDTFVATGNNIRGWFVCHKVFLLVLIIKLRKKRKLFFAIFVTRIFGHCLNGSQIIIHV